MEPLDHDRIARLLGADRHFPVTDGAGGTMDVAALPMAVRLAKERERAKDLAFAFGEERWRQLEAAAEVLREQGRDVSALQLAMDFVDRGLKPQ